MSDMQPVIPNPVTTVSSVTDHDGHLIGVGTHYGLVSLGANFLLGPDQAGQLSRALADAATQARDWRTAIQAAQRQHEERTR